VVTQRADDVREAFSSFTRAVKRVVMYRHARDQHAAYLAPALSALQGLLEANPHVTLGVEPGALGFEGEVVHNEPAREGNFCFRLHRDGVRSLTFERGVDLSELLQLIDVAMPADPMAKSEDAVTQLWKAEMRHIRWTAVSGYRIEGDAAGMEEGAARARDVLDELGDDEGPPPPLLMTDEERAGFDPQDWGELARSVADILARIVERGFGSRDVPALGECLALLVAEMVERRQPDPLVWTLRRAANLTGDAAAQLRGTLAPFLAERTLLVRAIKLLPVNLLPVWLELLPPDAGPLVIELIAEHTAAGPELAKAVVDRLRECRPQVEAALAAGSPDTARALLGAARSLAPPVRAALAAKSLRHPSAQVRLAAVPLVGADAPQAIEHLGALLEQPDAALRMAAADALSRCEDSAQSAADLLVLAAVRPQFAQWQREEQVALYRALGRLRTPHALDFLADRLTGAGKRRLLGRKRPEGDQLLAVRGLAEDASPRALALLDDAATVPGAVGAACRAAATMARSKRGGP
jgi:hypothetical protein